MSPFQVKLKERLRKWRVTYFYCFVLSSLSLSLPMPTSAQNRFVSPPKTPGPGHEIDGKTIINTPNHNSSSMMHNIPYMTIDRSKLVALGQPCEHDSDCANFSICLLKLFEPDLRMKACQCDENEMIKANKSCFIKPGHQCYFPTKNAHGYQFIQCYPGSVCKSAVNPEHPDYGYCMCNTPSLETVYREVNKDFEMQHCAASSFDVFITPFGSLILCGILGFVHRNF